MTSSSSLHQSRSEKNNEDEVYNNQHGSHKFSKSKAKKEIKKNPAKSNKIKTWLRQKIGHLDGSKKNSKKSVQAKIRD